MRRKKRKTLLPTDFRDILSILSIIGFLAIFLTWTLNSSFLQNIMTPIFLILGGIGLLIVGKVFYIRKWISNGLQSNEYSMIFSVIFGLASVLIGLMILLSFTVPTGIRGLVGILALPPSIFILIDYIYKNT